MAIGVGRGGAQRVALDGDDHRGEVALVDDLAELSLLGDRPERLHCDGAQAPSYLRGRKTHGALGREQGPVQVAAALPPEQHRVLPVRERACPGPDLLSGRPSVRSGVGRVKVKYEPRRASVAEGILRVLGSNLLGPRPGSRRRCPRAWGSVVALALGLRLPGPERSV